MSDSSATQNTSDPSDVLEQQNHIPVLDEILRGKLLEIPEAILYIEKLQRLLKKLINKIKKLKKKLGNKDKKISDVYTQTDHELLNCTENSIPTHESFKTEPKNVTEDIKEAAEQAMQDMGFVYEEISGMYYDYNTGYYYNAEYGLYYDSKTGTYFNYNAEKQTYEFHSQVSLTESQSVEQIENEKVVKQSKQKRRTKKSFGKDAKRLCEEEPLQENKQNDFEEGECSDSEGFSCDTGGSSDASDIARQWPPCMRIIVESTEVPSLKKGSLYIVTFDGGTVGREGNHSILIPDPNISKYHLKFIFDKQKDRYCVIDMGSRNGTLLDGKRLTPSKQESEPTEINHGSKIQIGSSVLLCHIHNGSVTCRFCEPGYTSDIESSERIYNTNSSDSHKKQLKNLKKIYGLARQETDIIFAKGYTDRAQKRRDDVGSHNPYEKTQVASTEDSISTENKGFKLLSKMGWKQGQSLGKTGESGVLEPVQVLANSSRAGLGCTEVVENKKVTKKANVWEITQERFQKLDECERAFDD